MPRFSSPATRCGLITAEDRRGGPSCRDWLESQHRRTSDRSILAQQSFMVAYRTVNVICREFSCPILVGSTLIFVFNYLFHEIDSVSVWRGLASHCKIIVGKMNSKEFRRKRLLPNFNYIRVIPEEGFVCTKYVEDFNMLILSSVCSVYI